MDKITKKYVRLSLLLHLSPLILCLGIPSCGGLGKGKSKTPPAIEKGKQHTPQNKEPNKNILEAPKTIDVDTVTESDLNGYKKAIKKRFTPRKCPGDWYGGIGVQYEVGRKTIFNFVPAGYPAAKAGVDVGDQPLDEMFDYRGEIGKEVTVSVRKPDGRIKNYVMLREKICLTEKGK